MKVICYGDSNTCGYDPRSFLGSSFTEPWPRLLAAKTGWQVHNAGLNGRQIPAPGQPYPFADDTDLLIVMLGTNDLLQGSTAQATARRMETFLRRLPLPADRLVLIAPPPLQPGEWVQPPAQEQAKLLAGEYRRLAARLGLCFADAAGWNIPLCFDGVHFTEEGHARFAQQLLQVLR